MKKLVGLMMLVSFAATFSAQYMIVGKDSISLADFKKDNLYGLQNNGIEKTIATTQDFLLLQQFAAQQKIDTTASFRSKMYEREGDLREQFFYPKNIVDPVLNDYMKDSQTEREVLIFMAPKTEGDTNNYQQIYNDVKAGKITMEDAISKYTKGNAKPIFVKPGSIDNGLYQELKNLSNNSYTTLHDSPNYYAFVKQLRTRPTLGYMIFGTISFPSDENAEATKNKIYTALKSGKTFQEVASEFGANDHEKNNGGVIMGSPTLPDEVYEIFKGKKAGFYTPQPIVFDNKNFIFNIYNVEPYTLNEKNKDFFLRDMNSALYGEVLQDKMVAYLKSDKLYKETADFNNVKKSIANLYNLKDDAVLFQYKKYKTTAGDIKKMIGDKKSDAEKMSPSAWSQIISDIFDQNLMAFYSQDFVNQPEVSKQMAEFKKGLYSDYIFSTYLTQEIKNHPEWLTDYYNKNKANYMWGNRADGRVAIVADEKLNADIAKEIKDPKKWDALKAKFNGKLNDKKQVLVAFEKGEMLEDADIFTKYKVPFKQGVSTTKMEERWLVIAIDKILPPTQMTRDEAAELLTDAVTEQKLRELINQQKAKTNIVVQPQFMKDLEKNFKK